MHFPVVFTFHSVFTTLPRLTSWLEPLLLLAILTPKSAGVEKVRGRWGGWWSVGAKREFRVRVEYNHQIYEKG